MNAASLSTEIRLQREEYLEKSKHTKRGVHLYVFVHGLAGNMHDLRILRNHMGLAFKGEEFLLCSSIEQFTSSSSIATMGERVAKEIAEYIHEMNLKLAKLR